MKPLYIDYSGADAPRWVPFAKKKMQQFREQLERSGLEFGRKYLKFDTVSISFLMTPLFAKLRIETGAAPTFFALYNVNLTGSVSYQYLVAFDDEGDEQWRLSFGGHDTFSGFSRRLLGCSSNGEKVIVLERDNTTMRVKEVTNGAVTTTAEYDLSDMGYTDTFASTLPRVSLDGTRALFAGPLLNGLGTERVVFFYDKDLDPQIQAVEVALDWSVNHDFTLIGAADLSTAYCAFQRYRVTTAGTQPSLFVAKLTRTTGGEETPPELLVEDLEITTISGASHYVVVNEIACAPDGELAVGYSTVTPPTFSGATERDVIWYVQTRDGDIEVERLLASFPSEASLTDSPRVFSVTPGATTFAFRALSDGVVVEGVVTDIAQTVLAVGTAGAVVVDDGAKYFVRRAEGDFDLVDAPYAGGGVLHSFADSGRIYSEFNALVQPASERSVRRWAPETDSDTGEFVGYPEMVELGDTPLSITVSPVDPEVEETANVSGRILNVYVQRVVQS